MVTQDTSRLLARKHDVFAALHILEQDREDGLIDKEAYMVAKQHHEQEAAEILARLDVLGAEDLSAPSGNQISKGPLARRRLLGFMAAIACVAGALAFLVIAVHQRAPGETITGAVGQGPSSASGQPASSLQAAQQAVYRHPRSYEALVNLGTAYLQNGRVMEADLSYQSAMGVDPTRAAAPTFHAMLLGAVKRYSQALTLLSKVERDHPAYARAWLMDGILSSRTSGRKARAVTAWLRFLLLEPKSDLAARVRNWIVKLDGKK